MSLLEGCELSMGSTNVRVGLIWRNKWPAGTRLSRLIKARVSALDGSVMEAMPAIIMAKSGVRAIGPAGVADADYETVRVDVLTLPSQPIGRRHVEIPSDCLKR
jgi:hypothetical protein